MNIYIFNPEHDIALAYNRANFTPPHAARQLRHDLGFLPAVVAKAGDCVIVDEKDTAERALHRLGIASKAVFITPEELKTVLSEVATDYSIIPWGWDLALRNTLKNNGVDLSHLPSNGQLNIERQISHRAWAAEHLLTPLTAIDGTVGEAWSLHSTQEVTRRLQQNGQLVLKAPWSSSGRGIRYVSADDFSQQTKGWIENVINRQGCIMAEPRYDKALDFGMEFVSDGAGNVTYRGLSLFSTANGAYTGNIIGDEAGKEEMLESYAQPDCVKEVRKLLEDLLSQSLGTLYKGRLGVDMMIVRTHDGTSIHPCVEMNLRTTMGHVAIDFAREWNLERQVMRIVFNGSSYKLVREPISWSMPR